MAHPQELGWNWPVPRAIRLWLVLSVAAAGLIAPAPRLMTQEVTAPPSALQPTESEKLFLDRLMMAESGGRSLADNPRSTALGPYQFIGGTFLDLMNRYFPALVGGKADAEVLQLRTDHVIARDAALVYTRENAGFLAERGLETNAAHLRLAFLVGPTGAHRVIAAQGTTPVAEILSAPALDANPFLRGMTAAELIERAADDAAGVRLVTSPIPVSRSKIAGLRVRCSLRRPSCRKWVALAMNRERRKASAQAATTTGGAKPAEAGTARD